MLNYFKEGIYLVVILYSQCKLIFIWIGVVWNNEVEVVFVLCGNVCSVLFINEDVFNCVEIFFLDCYFIFIKGSSRVQ